MKFSIIVVALNPGDKLRQTVDSVLSQTYGDYEIVVKDGGSRDGSVEKLPQDERIRLFVEPDKSIYNAMNQAVAKAQGDYLLFLNCGDLFYDENVLEHAADRIEKEQGDAPLVLYGDTYGEKNNVLIASPAKIDGFACFRNIPCHQSCFYAARLCREKPFCEEYRIRADYDHFLWCFYRAGAKMVYLGTTVSSYEGGGYSESRENRRRDREEHRQITEEYMTPEELAAYRRTMLLTLAPVRSFLAENRLTSGIYHWIKDRIYHHKLRILAGIVLLVVELLLYFGTDVMLEERVNYLTGEGSWGETQTQETASFCQEFTPEYRQLSSLSFLMGMEGVTKRDGSVKVIVSDGDNKSLYEETLGFDRIVDGSYTDVNLNLKLSVGKPYYLTLVTKPSSAGEYPTVGVCGKEYYLPENGVLIHEDEMPGVQLVSRYQYGGIMPFSKARNIILLCILTALGVMFGLPDNKWVRRIVAVVILATAPYVLGGRLELLTYREIFYLPISLAWNVGIMYALEILVLLCTHSPRITIALSNIGLTLLYTINYFVVIYRGTPLRMNDFTVAGTVVNVMGRYSFVPNDHLALVWGMLIMFVVFGVQTGVKTAEGKHSLRRGGRAYWTKKLASYAATIAIAAAAALYGGYQLLYTDLFKQAGFVEDDIMGFAQDLLYYYNGYLVATCLEMKNSHITPPEGYSVERAAAILEAAMEEGSSEVSTEELPHVILILNESFADLRILGDLELNQENMEFFNSLTENTVRGYVNAPGLGGGTANSEFEVLTGCSMALFPTNYYPYQQAIKKPVTSLVSRMQDNGYTVISMHPANANNWNRKKVYGYYGFDESLWKEDFADAERIHNGAADAETYRRIIELYENRKADEKLFIFDLTMQNHGDYFGGDPPYEVQSAKIQDARLDQYLTLVKISDGAFEDLVGYFEKQDEKVVICMFGDHQPWLSQLITGSDGRDGSLGAEQMMKMYKTPFVIWANYDIEEADNYDISLNYLGVLLQRTAGIPLSPYFLFLEKQCEEYPIITVNGYVDSEGNYTNWSSEGNEFPEYRILQYNYLSDKKIVDWGF